ncbi:hypothetical protein FQN54_004440 [Arachnomyces sp. PD_36]|nr:hypothetical protein FQN54_004440 [Arachnomyces sp. PD_36]
MRPLSYVFALAAIVSFASAIPAPEAEPADVGVLGCTASTTAAQPTEAATISTVLGQLVNAALEITAIVNVTAITVKRHPKSRAGGMRWKMERHWGEGCASPSR